MTLLGEFIALYILLVVLLPLGLLHIGKRIWNRNSK